MTVTMIISTMIDEGDLKDDSDDESGDLVDHDLWVKLRAIITIRGNAAAAS